MRQPCQVSPWCQGGSGLPEGSPCPVARAAHQHKASAHSTSGEKIYPPRHSTVRQLAWQVQGQVTWVAAQGQAHARHLHYPSFQAGAGRSPMQALQGSCAAAAMPVAVASAHVPGSGAGSPVKHITSCQPLLCQGGGCRGHMRMPRCHMLRTWVAQHCQHPIQLQVVPNTSSEPPFLQQVPLRYAHSAGWLSPAVPLLPGALVICMWEHVTRQSSGRSRERPCASPSLCTPPGCACTPPAATPQLSLCC